MSADQTVQSSLEELQRALSSLENSIDARLEQSRDFSEAESELRRMNADRSRLAEELDQSQHRATRLEDANREVSRRLVAAMETIRAVLDRA